MVSFDSKTYSKRLLHLISWSHWFTFFNITITIVIASLYIIGDPLPKSLIGITYLLTTWVSHMAFLTFFTFVLTVFPLTLLFPNTKFIRISASLIFTLGLLLLVLDAFIYSRLGYHLNASSKAQILSLISSQIKDNSVAFFLISFFLCLIILAFELIVSNYAWKHLKNLQKTTFVRKIIIVFVGAFFYSHITHIWADATLNYDVLQQDTLLPLSYPSTAKTLLTKYGLFNQKDYLDRLNSPLNFTKAIPNYPKLTQQCSIKTMVSQSVFLVLTQQMISNDQINNFIHRTDDIAIKLAHHIDNANEDNAWFNLFYSLPSIYQHGILQQNKKPLIFQAVIQNKLALSYMQIGKTANNLSSSSVINNLFTKQQYLTNSASLLFANKLNNYKAGIHVFYFKDKNSFQFELFMDALLLAQKQKEFADIIWISSLGNITKQSSLLIKPSLLLWPRKSSNNTTAIKHSKKIELLTSQMDVMPTLMKHWLHCDLANTHYSAGNDLLTLKKARVIANTVDNGLMVFNKDKSIFIDQNGNFQSYSLQLQAPIIENPDFPLMIDGVRFIKQFAGIKKKSTIVPLTNNN